MKQFITAARVRSVLAGAMTDRDAAAALRAHGIKFWYSTDGGLFHIRIPARSGIIRVYKTAARSAPLAITLAAPAPFWFRRPVLHSDY